MASFRLNEFVGLEGLRLLSVDHRFMSLPIGLIVIVMSIVFGIEFG